MSSIMTISSEDILSKDKFRDSPKINFRLELDPLKYFYPRLINNETSNDIDNLGLTEEQIKYILQKSKEIERILDSDEYRSIFAEVFSRYLKFFIKTIEQEVEIIIAIKAKGDNKVRSSLEKIRKEGPLALRYIDVLKDINKWCDERDNSKMTQLNSALKYYMGVKRGPIPLSILKSLEIINDQRKLYPAISIIKRDIKSYIKKYNRREEILKKLDSKYSKIEWYKKLKEIAKETKEPIVSFIQSNPEKKLIIAILARKYSCFERTIEEVYRQRFRIIKKTKEIEYY